MCIYYIFLLIVFILFVISLYLFFHIIVQCYYMNSLYLNFDKSNLLLFSSGGENTNTGELTNGYNTSPELSASLDGLDPEEITEQMNISHTQYADGPINGEQNTSGHRYSKDSAEAENFTVQNCLECYQTESLGRRGAQEYVHSTCGHIDNNTISCHFCVKKDNS